MILPAPVVPFVAGETPGDRIARIVRSYAGCVALGAHPVRREELAALVGRGVDDESVVTWETNCCTFALGVLSAAGVVYHGLQVPLVNGAEFGVLVALGVSFQAWRTPAPGDGPPPRGALLWYHVDGKNVDHVEIALDPPDEHGGGGRPHNAITVGRGGDDHWSWGRPLHRWLDPDALQIGIVEENAPDTLPAAGA